MIRLFVVLYDGVSTDSQRNVILLQSMPSMKRGVQFPVAKHLFGIFPQRPRILSTLKIFIANYSRKIQLQSFVDRVCRHPVLANSEVSTNMQLIYYVLLNWCRWVSEVSHHKLYDQDIHSKACQIQTI